jgi:hypothetical protein
MSASERPVRDSNPCRHLESPSWVALERSAIGFARLACSAAENVYVLT